MFIPIKMPTKASFHIPKAPYPTIPTSDWKILEVVKAIDKDAGQMYILQINKEAEDTKLKEPERQHGAHIRRGRSGEGPREYVLMEKSANTDANGPYIIVD